MGIDSFLEPHYHPIDFKAKEKLLSVYSKSGGKHSLQKPGSEIVLGIGEKVFGNGERRECKLEFSI